MDVPLSKIFDVSKKFTLPNNLLKSKNYVLYFVRKTLGGDAKSELDRIIAQDWTRFIKNCRSVNVVAIKVRTFLNLRNQVADKYRLDAR